MKTNLAGWLRQVNERREGPDIPGLEAQALLAHVLGRSRAWVLAHPEAELEPELVERLDLLAGRLAAGTPLPYLTGTQEFYGLAFEVNPAVLIPRPETELLVEHALAWLRAHPGRREAVDAGTGSGCIAVTLAKLVTDLRVRAVDRSAEAVETARANVGRHGVEDRVLAVAGDLLEGIAGPVDLICANLPYIPGAVLDTLEVARHEPRMALDGGEDGLEVIRRLVQDAPRVLAPGGLMLLEVQMDQGETVRRLAREALPGADAQVLKDLAGLDRVVRVEQPGYMIRAAGSADLDRAWSVLRAQNLADYDQPGLTVEDLSKLWNDPGFAVGKDHWLVENASGDAVGYGEVRDDGDGDYQITVALDGERSRAAGGGAETEAGLNLLECMEKRAYELSGGGSFRIYCRTGIRNLAASRLLERRGFIRRLTFHIMEASLAHPPAAADLPEGVTIHEFRPGEDEQAVYRADEEASEDKGYHQPLEFEDWCRRMGRHSPTFDAGLWFLAFSDGALAGVAINFYDAGQQTAWVDHLGVRRPFRKQGIGMALLAHSLNVFYQRGYKLARLSVDSHSLTHAPQLYEKAGFQTVLGYHIYRK